MSFGFGAPVLLAGVAAALVPLLVHLVRRRAPIPTPFPAIVLLTEPTDPARRRRRLRRWLLLAVRMLLLTALAVALAKPYTERRLQIPAGATKRQAAVVLLDDSLSMRARRAGRRLFERARDRAAALLAALPDSAPVALLTVTGLGRHVEALTYDRERLRKELARATPSYAAGDLDAALARALAVLRSAPPNLPRAIYLLTDLTRTGGSRGEALLPRDVTLRVVDVAKAPLPNLAVVAAKAPPRTTSGATAVQVVLLRTGGPDTDARVRVRLSLGDRTLATRSVSLPREGTRRVELRVASKALPPEGGFGEVSVEADGGSVTPFRRLDALVEDNQRTVPLGGGAPLRLVLVDGDPREVRHEDEVFYLESAIRALIPAPRRRLRVVSPEELGSLPFGGVDALVLANVGTLARSTAVRISRYVRSGGALLVTLGNQIRPQEDPPRGTRSPPRGGRSPGLPSAHPDPLPGLFQALREILPAQLRAIWTRGSDSLAFSGDRRSLAPSGPHGGATPLDSLALASAAAPLLAALSSLSTRRSARATRVYRVGLLHHVRGRVLLRLRSGAPLVLSRPVGAGTVWLLATSIDRDWCDLVHRPAFLPFVRALLEGMTHRLSRNEGRSDEGRENRPVRVGQARTLRTGSGVRLEVRGPAGGSWRLGPAPATGLLRFSHTARPGGYRVFRARAAGRHASAFPGASTARALPEQSFTVVLDPAESDLRRTDRPLGQPGRLGKSAGPAWAPVRTNRAIDVALLCLLLLLAEALLAGRRPSAPEPP